MNPYTKVYFPSDRFVCIYYINKDFGEIDIIAFAGPNDEEILVPLVSTPEGIKSGVTEGFIGVARQSEVKNFIQEYRDIHLD